MNVRRGSKRPLIEGSFVNTLACIEEDPEVVDTSMSGIRF